MDQQVDVAGQTGLAVERVGPHVLLHDGGADVERSFLTRLPATPRELVVLLAGEAYRRPEVSGEVRHALHAVLGPREDLDAVWLAIDDLGSWASMLTALSARTDLDLMAPTGGLLFATGSGILVGSASGGSGWRRFRPDGTVEQAGHRYPRPSWERAWDATEDLDVAGLAVEPVLCGLAVRAAGSPPPTAEDRSQQVVLDVATPRLVLDPSATSGPAAVASLLASLPATARAPQLVPMVAVDPRFFQQVAAEAGGEVLATTGVPSPAPTGGVRTVNPDADGEPGFAPLATVVRYRSDGPPTVVQVADAPEGFRRVEGGYRWADGPASAPRIDVVPTGAVVTAAPDVAGSRVVHPDRAAVTTLELGGPEEPVGAAILAVAEAFATAVDPRARLRVRLVGRWTGEAPDLARRLLPGVPAAAGATVGDEPTVVLPAVGTATAAPSFGDEPTVALTPVAPRPTVGPTRPRPALPNVVPVVTESSVPDPPGEPARMVGPETPTPTPTPTPAPAPELDAPTVTLARGDGEEAGAPESPPSAAVEIVVRDSSEREQQRFAAAAGEAFVEALATVNAAFATWPALRRDASAAAKTDFVAVCLYLGGGDGGSRAVNDAIRVGTPGVVDAQVPCLVSGLRRLPTHRRALLHQSTRSEPTSEAPLVGRLVHEPGFVSASTQLDVTAPDAQLDVLIWPAAARRTSELISQPVDEAIFVAGTRFKALALREGDETAGGSAAPRQAVLMRELAPGESAEPDEASGGRDQVALARLDRALASRRRAPLRVVEDSATAARLTASLAGLDEPHATWAAESTGAGSAAAVAVGA